MKHSKAGLKTAHDYLIIISSFNEAMIKKVIQFEPAILNLEDDEGDIIYHNLWKFSKKKLFKDLFLQFSSSINFNHLNKIGLNTLSLAAHLGDCETLKLLLTLPRGEGLGQINLFQLNNQGYSILDLASGANHDIVLMILLATEIGDNYYTKKSLEYAYTNSNQSTILLLEKHLIYLEKEKINSLLIEQDTSSKNNKI